VIYKRHCLYIVSLKRDLKGAKDFICLKVLGEIERHKPGRDLDVDHQDLMAEGADVLIRLRDCNLLKEYFCS
jgi:hypothetical protein